MDPVATVLPSGAMSSAYKRRKGFHLSGGHLSDDGQPDGDEGLEFDNSGTGPLRVPGFGGIPVTAQRTPAERFAYGSHDWAQPRLTAREMAMLRTINLVTDTPGWHTAVFDDEAVDELRPNPLVQPLISDAAWSWCVAELRDKAEHFKSAGYVSVFDSGSCVVKADGLVANALLARLDTQVNVLASEWRQTQEAYYRLHPPPSPRPLTDLPAHDPGVDGITVPGADLEQAHYDEEEAYDTESSWGEEAYNLAGQFNIASNNLDFSGLEELLGSEGEVPHDPEPWPWVLRLIDPSMFPLVYGRTRVLSNGGQVDLENALSTVGQGETAPDPALGLANPALPLRKLSVSTYIWRVPECAIPYRWSGRFQWLPSEVRFTGEPGTADVKITTYINNLHPVVHRQLYSGIEDIVSLSLDPWNEVLVWRERYRKPPRILKFGLSWNPPHPPWAYYLEALDRQEPRQIAFFEGQNIRSKPIFDSWIKPLHDADIEAFNRDYSDAREKVVEFLSLPDPIFDQYWPPGGSPPELGKKLKQTVDHRYNRIKTTWSHPEPGVSFTYPEWKAGRAGRAIVPPRQLNAWSPNPKLTSPQNHEFYAVSLQDTFHKQGLQVIVGLMSIELTPEQTSERGYTPGNGDWYQDGLLNDHIVATTFLCISSTNTTAPSFHLQVEADLDPTLYHHPPGRPDELAPMFELRGPNGLGGDGGGKPALQFLGRVTLPPGRLLTIPAVIRRQNLPVRLIDPTRPGHVRVLVIHLVDPHYRVCSTRNVPPQQAEWWAEAGVNTIDWARWGLPRELVDMIEKEAGVGEWPMGREEAEELRWERVLEEALGRQAAEEGVGSYQFEWDPL